MRFSIRDLLAVMFLVCLAMLAWRTVADVKHDMARVALLREQIHVDEVLLRLDQPAFRQATLHAHDDFQTLQEMRERSLGHFELLRQKYSVMESRGAGVFSIRGIPSLQPDKGPAPVIYRFLVPTERAVWLKFGVYQVQPSAFSLRAGDEFRNFLSDSPFTASGPFETQVPPGDRTLTIAVESVVDGSLPLVMKLDNKILLRTNFVAADASGTSSSRISASTQLDFNSSQDLPFLMTAQMNLRTSDSADGNADRYACSVWLSDRDSNFSVFPGK